MKERKKTSPTNIRQMIEKVNRKAVYFAAESGGMTGGLKKEIRESCVFSSTVTLIDTKKAHALTQYCTLLRLSVNLCPVA